MAFAAGAFASALPAQPSEGVTTDERVEDLASEDQPSLSGEPDATPSDPAEHAGGLESEDAKDAGPPTEPSGPGQALENPLRAATPPEGTEKTYPCREPAAHEETALEATRRRLYRTVCGAAVWFDGLFGGDEGSAEGQNVRGRVELSTQYSEYWGFKKRGRLRVRADLPHFERKLHAFVGREDEDEFVADRSEGLALRSQFFEIESEDRWVAGLGYGLPGSYRQKNDVRVGARVRFDDPDVFVQLRHRRNWFLGARSAWRFRETLFYTVQDGFGSTTSVDFDHILNRKLLGRWANVGTISEATKGVRWRSAVIFYRSLREHQALAQETYVRGESDREVPLREYGLRLIYRRPILGRDWLYGEVVTGYGWIREKVEERRQGSALVGFGVNLLFGHGDPY